MTSQNTFSHSDSESLEDLARRAQNGDAASLDALAARVREPLRAFLVGRLPREADADDVAQETLMRAFSRLDQYDPERAFKTWLFTIGKRLAVNHVVADKRRQSRHTSAKQAMEPLSASPVEPNLANIWQCAKAILSDEAYRAIWMRYTEDASVKDVAVALGRTVVSTKVLLYRARKRLLKEIESVENDS